MSLTTAVWTFTIARADGTGWSISIRPPEFAEVTQRSRSQARAETDAGIVFVQDLGVEIITIEGSWKMLTRCERDDLEAFFGPAGALYQARPFDIATTGDDVAAGISTGLGLSTDEGYTTGQLVESAGAKFSGVRLDQAALAFSQDRPQRYGTSLRFRLEQPGAVAAVA